jgi:hypothetical protein
VSSKHSGRVTLKVTNRLEEARVLIIEPWATEYMLPAGSSFDVIAEGDLALPLEVEVADDRITVYAFDSAGALLTVLDNGRTPEEHRN